MNGWHNASRSEKCPVCGHDSWCSISDDGAVCVCRRTPSPHPTKSGNGWIHRLKERSNGNANPPPTTHNPPPTINHQPSTINHQPSTRFAALPTGNEQVRLSRYLMRELSLPGDMILATDVRWDRTAKAAAFPMRNAAGEVTGIRYRQLKTGRKWSLKGSKDGLFFIPEMLSAASRELVVCEGPTDMIAAVSCGLVNAVGRSSCMTGANALRELIRLTGVQRVTIVADDDEPKTRPDGSTWRPGLDGAKKLAADLGIASRIVFPAPGFKDLRAWYAKGGMTEPAFAAIAAGAKWDPPANQLTN